MQYLVASHGVIVISHEVVNTVILYSERKMVNRRCSYHTQVVYCGNLHLFDIADQAAGRSSGLSNQPAANILILSAFGTQTDLE